MPHTLGNAPTFQYNDSQSWPKHTSTARGLDRVHNGFLTTYEDLVLEAPTLVLLWIIFVGGCIGSFLNVVVYRWPRGLSLVHPNSRCPNCEHPIRWYDNLPVIGWMRLRGRCRDCRAAISVRYPVVEAVVAGFFLLAWLHHVGWLSVNAQTLRQDIGRFLAETTFGVVLLGCVLIDYDRQPLPWKLLAFALLPPLIMPWVVGQPMLIPTRAAAALAAGCLALLLHLRGQLVDHSAPNRPRWAAFGAICAANAGLLLASGAMLFATLIWYALASRRPQTHWIWTAIAAFTLVVVATR
jgi:prepilin signal peptidase PulO-like enzyme (type II secretory pathway)